jgi:hypothetical protein
LSFSSCVRVLPFKCKQWLADLHQLQAGVLKVQTCEHLGGGWNQTQQSVQIGDNWMNGLCYLVHLAQALNWLIIIGPWLLDRK